MTADAAAGAEVDVSRLLRRQLIVTGLGLAVLVIVVAFTRSQDVATASRPADVYVQAHLPPDPGSLHLAYLQLAATAAAAMLALGHAAHVAAFVFRRSRKAL